jgi:hypothetical protein
MIRLKSFTKDSHTDLLDEEIMSALFHIFDVASIHVCFFMMGSNNKDTYGFTLVAVGLLTGFFLGAGIVYLYTNRSENDLLVNKPIERIANLFTHEDEPAADDQQADNHQADDQQAGDHRADGHLADSILPAVKPAIQSTASTGTEVSGDTIPIDDIRIIRDQLIGIRGFYLPAPHDDIPEAASSRKLDSLIGGSQFTEGQKQILVVEFRESPLNYLAYMMGKSRLVVYGIDLIDMVSIYELDGQLYLKYNEQYYNLEYASEFRLLVPESNVEQIRKLDLLWP